jgi:hypothetical protein
MSKLFSKSHTHKKLQLLKQVISLAFIGTLIFLFILWWNKSDSDSDFKIEDSPMRVEMVKNIAQLANISYKDEVVVDTFELYANSEEMIMGNLQKIADFDNFKHGIKGSTIKRRLTLIVKGEVLIGFDLKKNQFKISETDSAVQISLPEPQIIDVLSTASSTKIFQENGIWRDSEITVLKNKARNKMRQNALELKLKEKAKENAKRFLSALIKKGKKIEFVFI